MFKNITVASLSLLLLLLGFQNCAQEGAFESQRTQSVELHSIDQSEIEPPHPLDNVEPKVEATTYQPILVDRYYIKSLMEDVFGPTAASADSRKIFLNAVDFGSPCSANESYNTTDANGKATLVNTMENCVYTSTNRLIPTILPQATSIRQALLTRSCSDWTNNSTTRRYALKKIAATRAPEASDENLLKAYRLFYRGKPDPHQGLLDALKIIASSDSGKVTENSWKSVLYTLCSSSYWQVL